MSGIAGYYYFNEEFKTSISVINDMLSELAHRGPDGSGVYIGKNIALGQTRLSLIDLEGGQQPISDQDGRLWIVFNGEIFNYIELREDLIKKGCKFKTKSDTEVILHAYHTYGAECLNKLNGQFAIAIWDNIKRELFLARDRVGICPLFYSAHNNYFIFGSEIKSIIEHPNIEAEISPDSLADIFTFGAPICPHTAFKNILELAPGNYMKVTEYGIFMDRYWSLSYPKADQQHSISASDAIDEFESLFSDAVKLRLRADVPVGAYLNGGIDSSATVYQINKLFPALLKTFSIGFEGLADDESSDQQSAIESLQTNHSHMTYNVDDIARIFSKVIWHTEIPLLKTNPAPMYLLSQQVSNQHYKIVVSSQGADDIFAGHDIFKEMEIRRFWAKYPESNLRPTLLKKIYPYLAELKDQNANLLKKLFGYQLTETNAPYYSHASRWNNTRQIQKYFTDSFKDQIRGSNPIDRLTDSLPAKFLDVDDLSKAQWLETSMLMSGYLLSSQGDRMTMANSIKVRYPFLDHRIIEFCNHLPPDLKLDGLSEKKLLKEMMAGKLSDPIIKRPSQTERIPTMLSMLLGKQRYLRYAINDKELKKIGIFEPDLVKRLIKKISKENQLSDIDNMALTGIISTQLFYNQFVNKKMRPKKRIGLTDIKIFDDRESTYADKNKNVFS